MGGGGVTGGALRNQHCFEVENTGGSYRRHLNVRAFRARTSWSVGGRGWGVGGWGHGFATENNGYLL